MVVQGAVVNVLTDRFSLVRAATLPTDSAQVSLYLLHTSLLVQLFDIRMYTVFQKEITRILSYLHESNVDRETFTVFLNVSNYKVVQGSGVIFNPQIFC